MEDVKDEAVDAPVKPLTFTEVMAQDDIVRELVIVPQWGGGVWVSTMTAETHCKISDSYTGDEKPSDDLPRFKSLVLLHSLQNEDGTPFMTEEDAIMLMQKNAACVGPLFQKASALNGFDEGTEKN